MLSKNRADAMAAQSPVAARRVVVLLVAAVAVTLTFAEPSSAMLHSVRRPGGGDIGLHLDSAISESDGVVVTAEAAARSPAKPRELSALRSWRVFKLVHGKKYGSFDEELRRFRAFVANLDYIERHNAEVTKGEGESFKLGLNEYSDMDNEEFTRVMNGFRGRIADRRTGATYFSPSIARLFLPGSVDWRKQGLVTPVKNQGQCGSCWAFSSTGALEGQTFKKRGRLVSLSEQNLIDCSTKWGNHGCNGGEMDGAFAYVKDNGGLDTEDYYPYEAEEGNCRYNPSHVGATAAGFVDIPEADERKLMEAVATVGPVAVAVDASHPSFQHYSNGVYKERRCSAERLDHGVLVVGYGATPSDGEEYWLVKNSWGASWGDGGYIRMSRNKGNQCGIASMASFPLV